MEEGAFVFGIRNPPLFLESGESKFVVELGMQGGEWERTQAGCLNEYVSWSYDIVCY